MFTTVVAWIMFCFGSFCLAFAVLDTIFEFSLTKLQKRLGIKSSYFTGPMAFVSICWFLSGWFLFG